MAANLFRFQRLLFCLSLCCIGGVVVAQDEQPVQEEVFSGPQVGETMPGFQMKLALGGQAGAEFDLVEQSNSGPLVVIFVHKRSRPAFGLANSVMRYCEQDGGDNLTHGICFLTADPTDTANWLGKIGRYFPAKTPVGYYPGGAEGPGSYGLNRNVELTVLVGKDNQVSANFALIQPGAHADGPKILAAIAAVTGQTGQPDINKYLPSNQAAQDAPIAIDPGLMKQIRMVNSKDAGPVAVGEGLAEIEKMIVDNKALQNQLGTIVVRWVRTKRVDSIGNADHQATIKKWASDYGPKMRRGNRPMNRQASGNRNADPKLTGLLRELIQKTNSNDQVDAAATAVEKYVDEHPSAAKELGRIANTVVGSDRLSNYGTAHAQEVLKAWAKKFPHVKK